MQPTYLPWLGYFALMDRVDTFVFLDSVQFAKRSWQQRNRIKTANGEVMLTIPVQNEGIRNCIIKEVRINKEENFIAKHVETIRRAYIKAPFYSLYANELFLCLDKENDSLCSLTTSLILKIKEFLGVKSEIIFSSDMDISGKKDELLADICVKLSAKRYISPVGSKVYLDRSESFAKRNIDILYNEYTHPIYTQLYGEFVPYMAIIDLLFNEGPDSLRIIKQGCI